MRPSMPPIFCEEKEGLVMENTVERRSRKVAEQTRCRTEGYGGGDLT